MFDQKAWDDILKDIQDMKKTDPEFATEIEKSITETINSMKNIDKMIKEKSL